MLIDEMGIDERVAKGAAWLDEHCPNWITRIDLELLDIELPTLCVLGQSFGLDNGGWIRLMDKHDMSQYEQCCFGFESKHAIDADNKVEYDYLTEAWTEYIENRRGI